MSKLKLYLLGPPQVELESRPLEIKRRKALALLIYLAVTGEPQRRDTLATLLWPDSSQSSARAALRRDLSILKKALAGDWLIIERETIGLHTGSNFWLDIEQFKQRVADCPEITPACLDSLKEAVDLYREDFLTGFTLPDCPGFDDWQFFQTEGLRQELASALERLVGACHVQNNFETAIPYARRQLALDPLHEPAHQELMQLYAWDGQRGAALRQYGECVRILEEELGVPPSGEITGLYEAIKNNQVIPPLPDEEIGATPPHNLPAQTTTFIGRTVELAAVREQLTRPEVRLLTLTGSGGTGKTRLGLEVAADVLRLFADGVFLVDLAPISDPALVDLTIAETLGVRPTGNRPVMERLIEYLQDKQMLLVLDNFEHVLPAAPMVTDLLAAASKLKALVTSRTLLRLSGEWDYPVPPLTLPDPESLPALEQLRDYEAVQMFGERARAVKPTFTLTADNAPAITQICLKLDGLPLAIELAAARMRLLPPQKILAQLSSRLQFLTGGPRDLPARQQTLRNTIDWSYDLLEADEKSLFQRLAVFAGGCTFEAAEEVGNVSGKMDTLNVLESLIDKNLLKQTEVKDEPHFGMLETIREYAMERLAESGQAELTRQRHAYFFMELAEASEPKLYRAEQAAVVKHLELEHDNLRTALIWSIEHAIEVALRLAGALGRFWHMHGHHGEGRTWLVKALAQAEEGDAELDRFRAKVLNQAGMLSNFFGEVAAAQAFGEESVRIWRQVGDQRGLANALCDLGTALGSQGDHDKAQALLDESVTLLRQLGDDQSLVRVLFYQSLGANRRGNYEQAWAIAEESVALGREVGDISNMAAANAILGSTAFTQGDYLAAQSYLEESLSIFRQVEDKPGIAIMLDILGTFAYKQGHYEQAKVSLEESLLIWQEMGNKFDATWGLYTLGYVALHQGHWQQATALFEEGLVSYQELDEQPGIARCLVGLAELAEKEGRLDRAARLFGATDARLDAMGLQIEDTSQFHYAPVPDVTSQAEFERQLADVRAALGDEAFNAAWAEGRAMSLEQAIAYALSG